MKKFIPLSFLALALLLCSCRPSELYETELADDSRQGLLKRDSDSSNYKKEVDPDPPVKDGQDWKH